MMTQAESRSIAAPLFGPRQADSGIPLCDCLDSQSSPVGVGRLRSPKRGCLATSMAGPAIRQLAQRRPCSYPAPLEGYDNPGAAAAAKAMLRTCWASSAIGSPDHGSVGARFVSSRHENPTKPTCWSVQIFDHAAGGYVAYEIAAGLLKACRIPEVRALRVRPGVEQAPYKTKWTRGLL